MKEIIKTIKTKRNTDMPITIVENEGKKPLIVYVHGFKANRTEDDRFLEVARKMDAYGICMGFAGCDVSTEDFFYYTLDNCLDDINSAYEYMLNNYDIDTDHLGMVGYSMGGRLASIFSYRHKEFKNVVFWAAANQDYHYDDKDFLGNDLSDLKACYEQKGYCDFYNDFDGQTLKMNYKLIENMVEYRPLVYLQAFKGNALIVHGKKDITVDPEVADMTFDSLVCATNRSLHYIGDTNHGFGLWDDHLEKSRELVDTTVSFLKEYL